MRHVVGLLLAGGASRRYGANKLVSADINGTPLGLRSAANLAAASLADMLVVVPTQPTAVAELFAPHYAVSRCAASAGGIAHSIAHGVEATRDADGWLIALADMPFVRPDTIRAVAATITAPATIARPMHSGRAGHPVAFGAAYRDELLALTGDAGAASVIGAHPQALVTVNTDDDGVLNDIDRPSDLPGGSPTR